MNLSLTFVDIVVIAVIVISAGYAAWRGFLSETLTIFAWAAAAFATLYFGPWVVPLAQGLIATPWLAALLAYAGVFLVVFIPLSFMSYRFAESVRHSPIGPLDRALGVAFGVVRGLVIVGMAYLAFTYFEPIREQPAWLNQARLLPLMQSTGEVLLSLVPSRDRGDFAAAPAKDDRLGDLIRQNDRPRNDRSKAAASLQNKSLQNNSLQHKSAPDAKVPKGYGTADRRALDRLMETTAGSGKP